MDRWQIFMILESYTEPMSQQSPLEDWRGVDVGQIRDLLAMSVAERAAEMVRVANVIMEMQAHIAATRDQVDA